MTITVTAGHSVRDPGACAHGRREAQILHGRHKTLHHARQTVTNFFHQKKISHQSTLI